MDPKEAKTRYLGYMVAIIVTCFVGMAPLMFYLYRQVTRGEENQITPLSGALSIGAALISVVLIIFFAKRARHFKEMTMYDEFGVRKDFDNLLELNSKDREAIELQALAELERALPKNMLDKMKHAGSSDPEKDLKKLIGIEPIKKKVLSMKARMEFEDQDKKKRTDARKEGHHMVFTGAPGTGKTTLARIMAGLLYEYEYIDKNLVIECDGNFLKGVDAATTQLKVRYLCKAAYGGVLFVDEAYALTQSGDEAGLQAVATLIKEMEDHRDKFVVILAGYTNEIKLMLDANPGFRSRIKEYLDFPDYTDEELYQIFTSMAQEKDFKVPENIPQRLSERFKNERMRASWGNARTVRNVLEETITNHAYRFMEGKISDKKDRFNLLPEDVSPYPQNVI